MRAKEISNIALSELGHADKLHIKVTNKDLIDRILYPDTKMDGRLENYCKTLATRFYSEEVAIKAARETLERNQKQLISWTELRFEKRMEIECFFKNPIGEGIVKGTDFNNPYPMNGIRLILSLGYNSDFFDIITAYPIPNSFITEKINADRTAFKNNRRRK